MAAKVGDTQIVGQSKLITTVETWKEKDTFPHFLLVAGDVGSGRKLISYFFAQMLDARVSTVEDISVASIRRLIDIAYQIDSKMVYLIPNADGMSVAAKNSLLKLTEEPPANAYIIMTLESLDNTLPTLRSRSQHLVMEPYTKEQLLQLSDNELLCSIASNPGMLETLSKMKPEDVDGLVETCKKLISFIDKVTVANALKSAQKIKFKDSDKSVITLDLFLSAMNHVLATYINDSQMLPRVVCWYRAIAKHRPMFLRSGVNKRAVYDMMIVHLRQSLSQLGGVS